MFPNLRIFSSALNRAWLRVLSPELSASVRKHLTDFRDVFVNALPVGLQRLEVYVNPGASTWTSDPEAWSVLSGALRRFPRLDKLVVYVRAYEVSIVQEATVVCASYFPEIYERGSLKVARRAQWFDDWCVLSFNGASIIDSLRYAE